jgi:hypothetical protein
MGNVAIVTRDADGKVDFTESQVGASARALVGAIAGLVLPGVGIITLAAGARWRPISSISVSTRCSTDGRRLTVSSSMLVALIETSNVERAKSVVADGGGVIMGSTHETDLATAMAGIRGS